MIKKQVFAAVVGLGLLAGLVAGVLIAVGPASAAPPVQAQTTPQAQTPPAAGAVAWAAGKITAVQQNGFTLQDDKRQTTTTVTVGANTWIVVQKNNAAAEGALADLKVGDRVFVGGVANGTNGIAARTVQVAGAGPAFGKSGMGDKGGWGPGMGGRGHGGFMGGPGMAGKGLRGTVQSVANGSVTVSLGQNNSPTLTVTTDAGTVVIKNGLAAVADLKAGDTVQIIPRFVAHQPGQGRPTTMTADAIAVTNTGHALYEGMVQSVSGSTLTLGGPHNNQGTQVTVDANATIKRLSADGTAPAAASLSDIQAGTRVVLYGATPAQGQTGSASVVLILPAVQKPQPAAPTGNGL